MLYSWRFSSYSAPIHWLVHDHMTPNNEAVPAKCHERATLRKLWRQTGTVHCYPRNVDRWCTWSEVAWCSWNLSAFFKICLVLFCYMTNHSMTSSLGNSDFVSLLESQCSSRRKFSFSGNRIHCSSLDQSFSVKCQPIPTCLNRKPVPCFHRVRATRGGSLEQEPKKKILLWSSSFSFSFSLIKCNFSLLTLSLYHVR